jgi:hypothetical protein
VSHLNLLTVLWVYFAVSILWFPVAIPGAQKFHSMFHFLCLTKSEVFKGDSLSKLPSLMPCLAWYQFTRFLPWVAPTFGNHTVLNILNFSVCIFTSLTKLGANSGQGTYAHPPTQPTITLKKFNMFIDSSSAWDRVTPDLFPVTALTNCQKLGDG